MRYRVLSLLAVLLVVTACSTKPKDDVPVMEIGTVDDRTEITTMDNMETVDTMAVDSYGPTPGTQQDLVVNVGDRVFFDYDSYALTAEARSTLERQASWLKQFPQLSATIEGHCDERGTREYNLALGEKRANAAMNYLVAMGIDPRRLNTISYGKERPAALGSNASSWSQNRRGVLAVE